MAFTRFSLNSRNRSASEDSETTQELCLWTQLEDFHSTYPFYVHPFVQFLNTPLGVQHGERVENVIFITYMYNCTCMQHMHCSKVSVF